LIFSQLNFIALARINFTKDVCIAMDRDYFSERISTCFCQPIQFHTNSGVTSNCSEQQNDTQDCSDHESKAIRKIDSFFNYISVILLAANQIPYNSPCIPVWRFRFKVI
jgi:hypothetical protein